MNPGDSQSHKSVTLQLLCQRFIEEWKAGKRPEIASFLEDIDPQRRRLVLAELLSTDVAQRRKQGENPTADEYLQQFPADQSTISAAFDALNNTLIDTRKSTASGAFLPHPEIGVGQKLGKYEITSILGQGGMGVVFGASDSVIRREVAIKQLSQKHLGNETAVLRLLQEARTAGSLQHSNIVAIYDVVEQDGSLFLVMERVHGDNLSDLMLQTNHGRLDWKLATSIAIDCCDALEAAHGQGMIHRDIKPQNIMLTKASRAKLLDFGLAKAAQSDQTALTAAGTILGTPDFMSPEQFRGSSVDYHCDLYSLGATYYALLTGRPPFAGAGDHLKTMYAHCNEPAPKASAAVLEVPTGCDAVIQRAMAKEPADRFQSAAEFRQALQGLLASNGKVASMKPAGSGRSRFPWAIAGGVVAMLVCLVAGAAWWMRTPGAGNAAPVVVAAKDQPSIDNSKLPLFPGVTANAIHFGTTTAYSGPNSELGQNMVLGIRTCFAEVNANGGIHGRKLELHVLDDGYVPAKALENMHELFEKRKTFAVVGNVGTPTASATVPYSLKHKHLFFAPLSGARLLRNEPPDRYVFNYRASYADETAAMVRYFVELRQIPAKKIAVFAQNDSYGDDGFSGVVRAMRGYGVREEDILRVGHERNSVDVTTAVQTLLNELKDDDNDGDGDDAEIAAVVMVTSYKPAARFIRQIREKSPNMVFGAVSFVGSDALAEQFQEMGAEYGEGVIVTQVVPHYLSNSTGVIRYRELLKKHFPEHHPGFVSLEGFIAAECLVEGLRVAGPELTTESLVTALESIQGLDLGIGPIISFGPSRHQASNKVWGTKLLKTGEFEVLQLD